MLILLKLLAIWFIYQWQSYGKGHPIRIIELGPGRGTLMDDILRVS
jgi:NADH dehydrogenase [ubiquinone] 1 alpha subcomplex assembly factor 7